VRDAVLWRGSNESGAWVKSVEARDCSVESCLFGLERCAQLQVPGHVARFERFGGAIRRSDVTGCSNLPLAATNIDIFDG